MQLSCRRTLILKCDVNKVALQPYWNHTSGWVFSCKLAAFFWNTFSSEYLWKTASSISKTPIIPNSSWWLLRGNCLGVSKNREGEKTEERIFKANLDRNKYEDFPFKFLSKLSNEFIRYQYWIWERNVCCVYVCKTNCSSEKSKSDKRSVYLFSEDETVKEKWIKAISNTNLRVS